MQPRNTTSISTTWTWPGFKIETDSTSFIASTPRPKNPTYERCQNAGLILPLMNEENWSDTTRAIVYFLALLYTFLGAAVLSEALMRAVERITSATRKVKLKSDERTDEEDEEGSESGEYEEIRIWNPTVANLTLMTLASNAPQILLPLIQLAGSKFVHNDLGPATVVGSAAFNLFILIPACILVVPKSISKRVQSTRVYLTNISWSIFAYIWLIIILLGSSHKIIDVWEGTITFVLFPVAILTVYLADRNMCEKWRRKRMAKQQQATTVQLAGGIQVMQPDVEVEIVPQEDSTIRLNSVKQHSSSYWRERFAANPLDYVDTSEWREVSRYCAREHPELPPYELAKLVAYRVDNQRPHDRLWYRIKAVKRLSASIKREAFYDPDKRRHLPVWSLLTGGMRQATSVSSISTLRQATMTRSVKRAMTIEFSARVYVLDPGNENRVRLTVIRRGRTHKKAMFRYETLNGTAQRETHYLYKCETVVFQPGETHKVIHIDIINGQREWKRRDMFYVKLELDTIMNDEKIRIGQSNPAEILYPSWERDNVEVEFAKSNVVVRENEGIVRLPIVRKGAIKNTECTVEWATEDITAVQGKDYEGAHGELQFYEGEREKYLDIAIIDDVEVEKMETFAVNIINVSDGATGTNNRAVVTILNDDRTNRFLTNVDQMVPTVLQTLEDTGRTWRDQLMEASCVNDGDVDNATPIDCIAHILAFPWKVLRAAIPPVNLLGGWLTFIIALILIGFLTAIMGDLAVIFSCTVKLPETIMAITVMAFGLNMPDLLAARLAAMMDTTADTAIGHIPAVNVVTVLLGLGLPWFIASVVREANGTKPFILLKEDAICRLCFIVPMFTICSLCCYGILLTRRRFASFGKGELGGPTVTKILCAAILIFLWCLFVLLCSLQAYKLIGEF